MNKEQLRQILSAPYSDENWQKILRRVFKAQRLYAQPVRVELPQNSIADNAWQLGLLTDVNGREIGLYRVDVKPGVVLERNKVGLRQLLRNFYRHNHDAVLVVFNQGDLWRVSFISEIKDWDPQGNPVEITTDPKRYTYLLGKDMKVMTPVKQWSSLLAQENISLEDILDAFSVEVLNKEFYRMVSRFFHRLMGTNDTPGELKLPSTDDMKTKQEFAIRLIGRIIFLWFLKEKKSKDGVPLLPEKFLSSKYVQHFSDVGGYYHSLLEKLFFLVLNRPYPERPEGLPPGCEIVPFLNGGLFEAHRHDFFVIKDHVTGLSHHINTLVIPDQWFEEFYAELEKYHFTLDENSSVEMDISVDPEMLGRIFENLLAEINPETGENARNETGSFYTPREVVEFISAESLVQYLYKHTGIAREKLRDLFRIYETHKWSGDEAQMILQKLSDIKIVDPACGSGAFPMGALHKIVTALEKLDPKAEKWKKLQAEKIPNALARKTFMEKMDTSTAQFARKMGVIQQSLYGVDIQPIATEISKLRIFLSLVVDEEPDDNAPNRGIQPLPNLEFKFVTADTLKHLPITSDYFSIPEIVDQLKEIRNEYFLADEEEKKQLRETFEKLQDRLYKQLQKGSYGGADPNTLPYLISTWKPFEYKKTDWFDSKWMFGVEYFDVVIGNPPYIRLQRTHPEYAPKKYADLYKDENYETFDRNGDIYALFYERGLQILKRGDRKHPGGVLGYITSNKWMRAAYGQKLRMFLARKNPLILLDLGPGVFSATVDTNILLVENAPNHHELLARTLHNRRELERLQLTEADMIRLEPSPWGEPWLILSPEERAIKERIEKVGTPLKEWDVKIYRGVLTGFNEAFIIDGQTKDRLIAEDPKSAEIIKPILRGRDIKRYRARFADRWLINTHNDYVNTNGERIPPVNVSDYPAIKKHLDQFYEKLERRQDKGVTPYNLRNCAYIEEFEKEKIVWQEIVREAMFHYDTKKNYVEATAFLMTGKNLKYLVSLLNSKPVTFFFKTFYAGGGLGEKGFRYKKKFLLDLPLPILSEKAQRPFAVLVDYILYLRAQERDRESACLERIIDGMVYELYFGPECQEAGCRIAEFVKDIPPLPENLSPEEKEARVNRVLQELCNPEHPLDRNLETLLQIPYVRTVEEAIKR